MKGQSLCLLIILALVAVSSHRFSPDLIRLQYLPAEEAQSLVSALVPDIECTIVNARELSLQGEPGAVKQARQLLDEIDYPPGNKAVVAKLVVLTPHAANRLQLPKSPPDSYYDGDCYGSIFHHLVEQKEAVLVEDARPFPPLQLKSLNLNIELEYPQMTVRWDSGNQKFQLPNHRVEKVGFHLGSLGELGLPLPNEYFKTPHDLQVWLLTEIHDVR